MTQTDVVEGIMVDLLDNNMCARAFHYELRGYLAQAYAAGYEQCLKEQDERQNGSQGESPGDG